MNGNACKSEKQSQTTAEMDQLDKGINMLSDSISNLMDRLGKVLRTSTPMGDCEKMPAEELVPMANSIRALRYRVLVINNDVQDILNRLEL